MYYNRVIPCLLIDGHKLLKTIKFKKENYIGDPINAVHIFNEKAVDELIVIDYKASYRKHKPDFLYINEIAGQCFMPMAYGGGISTLSDIRKLFEIGIEKVVVNTMAFYNPVKVKKAVYCFGSQSIVGAMDVKKNIFGNYTVRTNRGRHNTNISPVYYAQYLEKIGVGEIFLNNISRDGTMQGYDIKMIKEVTKNVNIHVTVCGSAGKVDDLYKAIHKGRANAVAAGSLFVYYGSRKSILINYPDCCTGLIPDR